MQQTIKPIAGIFTYALGISLVALLPDLPSMPIVALIGMFALILTVAVTFRSMSLLLPLASLLLGMTIALCYGKWLLAHELPADWEGRPLVVEGVIMGLPAQTEKSCRFEFMIKGGSDKQVNKKVRLSWFGAPELLVNQQWRLTIKLRKPHGFASPGAFDLEAWAAREGVLAMGYVLSGELLADQSHTGSVRQRLSRWLTNALPPERSGGLKALLVGEKSGVSAEQWRLLNATGTTHLLVISGLHIGLMALLGYWLALLAARLGVLPLTIIPLPKIAAFVSLLLAGIYASLAGLGIPVQRALIMTTVAMIGPALALRPAPITLLIIALAVVLTVDPLAVTSAGFWYSFMAVAALIYGLSARYGEASLWGRWLKPQWVVFCVMTPLLFFNGQPVSVIAPLINLIAIPYIGLLVVPLLLCSAAMSFLSSELSLWLLSGVDQLLQLFFRGLEQLADMAMLLPITHYPEGLAVIFAVTGGLLLISPLPTYLRALSPLFLLPCLFPVSKAPDYGQAWVMVLDVGQGLSVLIRTQQHTMIYDTGDAFSDSFNAADRVIIPCLRKSGVRQLDKIIISHGDKDHAGGLKPLLAHYHCTDIACGTRIPFINKPISCCQASQHWDWDGVNFQVLAGGGRWRKTNDRSCVLKITAGNDSLLLAGDISHRVEAQLLAAGKPVQATILLAPHHGSRYSSSSTFLQAVNPEKVVFSSGYNNQFGHPAKATLARVSQQGAESWNTAQHGSLSFLLGGGNCVISAYRCSHRRYWWHSMDSANPLTQPACRQLK